MATTVRASSQNQQASANSIVLTAPTGTTDGDVVICAVHGNTQATLSDGNGATPFTADLANYKPNTSSGHVVSIFSRRIQAGDPSTYTFNSDATNRISGIAVTFQNPHPTDIYDVAPSTTNADNLDSPPGSSGATAPSITTLTDNAINCALAFIDASVDDFTGWPSGYTVLQSVDNNQGQTFTVKVITPAGATGEQAFTHNGTNTAFIGLTFAIKTSVDASTVGISKIMMQGMGR